MSIYNNVIIGQKVIIIDDDKRILIMKRDYNEVYRGYWDFPGGKLESGDTLKEGIEREVYEETGLKIQRIILTLYSSFFKGNKHDNPYIMRNIYLCLANGKVKLSNEHSEFRWIQSSELSNYKFAKDQDLQNAINYLHNNLDTISIDKPLSLVT